jgi:hypothetical protein
MNADKRRKGINHGWTRIKGTDRSVAGSVPFASPLSQFFVQQHTTVALTTSELQMGRDACWCAVEQTLLIPEW